MKIKENPKRREGKQGEEIKSHVLLYVNSNTVYCWIITEYIIVCGTRGTDEQNIHKMQSAWNNIMIMKYAYDFVVNTFV